MLPFLTLPLWETDATLRAAVEQSAQASVTSLGSGAVLLGADLSFEARAAGPRAAYVATGHAEYAHAFDVAVGGGAGPPSYNLDADTTLSAAWTLSPQSYLTLDTEGSLATTYGIQADSQLLALDPFLFAQRLEYAMGHTLTWSLGPTPRAGFSVEGGYLQTGALAAEAIPVLHQWPLAGEGPGPAAPAETGVGVDTHEGHAAVSYSYDLGLRDSVTPELRYDYAHYYHALYDVHFHRGPADIHTGTISAAASHEVMRGFTAVVKGGISVGNAMPVVQAGHPVVAPDVSLTLRWTGRRARLTARAQYAYTSLGPRIGFGQQASGKIKLDVRPWDGARYRDLLLHGTLRFAHGAAPLGADPEPVEPGSPPLPTVGTLTATTIAARTRVEIPLARGIAFITGGDVAFVRGVIEPAPVTGQTSAELLATLTVGLAVTVATDKRRTVPRDPEAEQEEEARRRLPEAGEGQRFEDRAEGRDEP
jgi:hypothetical protein